MPLNTHQLKMRLPIEKRQVWQAYQHVRLNKGSHGVDEQDWKAFDAKRYHNLYIIWNRLSSGAYFPKAVRRVMIPKSSGGQRPLGIPTVGDRIAQEVLRQILEPYLEPNFHVDSYAYRRSRSAHDALGECRARTDYYSWAIDVDIKGYFDNIPHDKLMQAVQHYCPQLKWLHTYLWRILQSPVQLPDGRLQPSMKGVPQGGVISPLLANLYLHVVFDAWIGKKVRAKFAFERYADDMVIHTVSEDAAKFILKVMRERFTQCGLELHPEKTRVVQTENRKDVECRSDCATSFVFLGHKFCKQLVRVKDGTVKLLYQPRISDQARKRIFEQLKYLKLHRRTDRLEQLADELNQKVRGWIAYFDCYARSSMLQVYAHINYRLVKWCSWKYKKFKGQALRWLKRKWAEKPQLFAHWQQTRWFCYPFKGAVASKR